MDARNKHGADKASDYHLQAATIRLRVAAVEKKSNQKTKTNFHVEKLKDSATFIIFTESLTTSIPEHIYT